MLQPEQPKVTVPERSLAEQLRVADGSATKEEVAALRAALAAAQRERDEAKADLDAARQIGDTFWDVLKLLNLPAINVTNPGSHVADLIRDRDDFRAKLATRTAKLEVAYRERDIAVCKLAAAEAGAAALREALTVARPHVIGNRRRMEDRGEVPTDDDLPLIDAALRSDAGSAFLARHAAELAEARRERDERQADLKAMNEAFQELVQKAASAMRSRDTTVAQLRTAEARERGLRAMLEELSCVPMVLHHKDSRYPTCPICHERSFGAYAIKHKEDCKLAAALAAPATEPAQRDSAIDAAVRAEREACIDIVADASNNYLDQMEGQDSPDFDKLEFAYVATKLLADAIRARTSADAKPQGDSHVG